MKITIELSEAFKATAKNWNDYRQEILFQVSQKLKQLEKEYNKEINLCQ